MAFVDPNVLLANAAVPCLDKCLPPGIQWSILISLAARWGGLSTDPAVLLAGAPCFDKCISPGMQRAVLVSLAAQIAGNTGPPIMPPAPVYGPDLVPDFASYNDPFEGPFCSYTITGLTVGLTYYIVPDPQTAGNIPLPNYTQPTQFVASDTTLELIGPCGMNVAATLQLVTFPEFMAETTDQLMNDARCIDKCIPDGMKLAVLISIFQQILTNGTGGGGGGSGNLAGIGSPVGVANATAIGQFYTDYSTPTVPEIWVATSTGTGGWQQIIS